MELSFVISFAVLCLVISAYWFGKLSGPIRVELTLAQEVAVALSGSHAVAMDGIIHVENGGVKLPEGALVLTPLGPRQRRSQ